METLEQILKNHAHRYPNMQSPDAVKLIWQNVFGSGTLRRDPASYRCALMHEYEDVHASAEISLVENIGNGFVRINLAATHWCGYSPERLGYDYVDSARHHQGSRMGFQVKLDVLRRVARTGTFGFSEDDLECYLCEYDLTKCPEPSHSPEYHENYHPAYRVVQQSMLPEFMQRR